MFNWIRSKFKERADMNIPKKVKTLGGSIYMMARLVQQLNNSIEIQVAALIDAMEKSSFLRDHYDDNWFGEESESQRDQNKSSKGKIT